MSASRWIQTAITLLVGGLIGWFLCQYEHRADTAVATQAAAVANHTAVSEPSAIERTATGLIIHLDRGANPPALASGWSTSEAGLGVWTNGHKAILKLDGLPTDRPAQVSVIAIPFLAPSLAAQDVDVRAKGQTLAHWKLVKSDFQPLTFQLPTTAQTSPGVADVEFDLPDADSPEKRTAGSHDTRLLGISVKSVSVAS